MASGPRATLLAKTPASRTYAPCSHRSADSRQPGPAHPGALLAFRPARAVPVGQAARRSPVARSGRHPPRFRRARRWCQEALRYGTDHERGRADTHQHHDDREDLAFGALRRDVAVADSRHRRDGPVTHPKGDAFLGREAGATGDGRQQANDAAALASSARTRVARAAQAAANGAAAANAAAGRSAPSLVKNGGSVRQSRHRADLLSSR